MGQAKQVKQATQAQQANIGQTTLLNRGCNCNWLQSVCVPNQRSSPKAMLFSPNWSNPENPIKNLEHIVDFEHHMHIYIYISIYIQSVYIYIYIYIYIYKYIYYWQNQETYIFDCFPQTKRKLKCLTLQLFPSSFLDL